MASSFGRVFCDPGLFMLMLHNDCDHDHVVPLARTAYCLSTEGSSQTQLRSNQATDYIEFGRQFTSKPQI